MANILRVRRSSTVSVVPANGTLQHGELAINTADGKLFYGKVVNTVGTLATGGGGAAAVTAVRTVTTSTVVLSSDELILCDLTTGALSVTLPLGTIGQPYTIKKLDASANLLTVNTTGGQLIDGGTFGTVRYQYTSFSVVSDGSNWQVI